MTASDGAPRAIESLYVEVEAKGSRLAKTFGWLTRLLGGALLGEVGVQPSAVVSIRSRGDDALVYQEIYRIGMPDAIAAKERFESELRTLTVAEFKEQYGPLQTS